MDDDLTIQLPHPLFGLTRSCETECVVACCGIDAFDVDAPSIVLWVREHGDGPTWLALDQLADLSRCVEGHTGPVTSGGDDFNQVWPTAAEAGDYLRHWRREVIRAIEAVTGRPLAVHPDWRTSSVVALAEGVYADRAFDRLPILADALEDAGYTHPDLMGHLRGPGPHARGCWVVDLILGKS